MNTYPSFAGQTYHALQIYDLSSIHFGLSIHAQLNEVSNSAWDSNIKFGMGFHLFLSV
jgi:hypothetical protein